MLPTTSKSRVTVQIATLYGMTHLPSCLQAVSQQDFPEFNVLVIDNGSLDSTVRWLEEHYPHYHLLRNTRNTGFCHAHNQGFRITKSEYILSLNQDVVLSPDWIRRGIEFLDTHPEYATYSGKTLRFDYSKEELKSIVVSDIIDTTGIQINRSRHATDRGSGEVDRGQWDTPGDVFGPNGACVLYRMRALEMIRFKNEFFDEDFFAYKDDVDTSWRLQRMGWNSWYDPSAVAYHHRGVKGSDRSGNIAIAQTHRRRQRWNTALSYRNHLFMLIKNETSETFWPDAARILWYEFRKAAFLLLTQPSVIGQWMQVLRLRSTMRQKGRMIQDHARRSALDVRAWFIPRVA